jgi:hypothetical protein
MFGGSARESSSRCEFGESFQYQRFVLRGRRASLPVLAG